MLDSMVFDFIVADSGLIDKIQRASASEVFTFITTHIQEDQLGAISDREKAEAIAMIPRQQIPTSGFVLGLSRLGMARLGEPSVIDALRQDNWPKHTEDALIGATAHADADVLVTDDRTLTGRADRLGIRVWSLEEFRVFVMAS